MKKKSYGWYIFGGIIAILILWWIISSVTGYKYPEQWTEKPVLGNSEATVQIVEYSDIQCPACGSAHPIIRQLTEEYGEQISFEYRHFPLTSIHPFAYTAAVAAECANDYGKYYEFLDVAFRNNENLGKGDLVRYAEQLEIPGNEFKACLKSRTKKGIVDSDMAKGRTANIQGTPTFLINNKPVSSWQYDSFKSVIENEIANS